MHKRWREPEPNEENEFQLWLNDRPEHVKEVASRFRPWELYRLRTTNHIVALYSVGEGDPVTVKVTVSGQFNTVCMERRVFGINPDDLIAVVPMDRDQTVGNFDFSIDEIRNLEALYA